MHSRVSSFFKKNTEKQSSTKTIKTSKGSIVLQRQLLDGRFCNMEPLRYSYFVIARNILYDQATLIIFEIENAKIVAQIDYVVCCETKSNETKALFSVSLDRTKIFCCHSDGVVRAWQLNDVRHPVCIYEIRPKNKFISDIAALSNEVFALAYRYGTVDLINSEEKSTHQLEDSTCSFDKLMVFYQQKILAAVNGHLVFLWDFETKKLLNQFLLQPIEKAQIAKKFFPLPEKQGFFYINNCKAYFCDFSEIKNIKVHEIEFDDEVVGAVRAQLPSGHFVMDYKWMQMGVGKIISISNIDHLGQTQNYENFILHPANPYNTEYYHVSLKGDLLISNEDGLFAFKAQQTNEFLSEMKYHENVKTLLQQLLEKFNNNLIDIMSDYTKNETFSSYSRSLKLFSPEISSEDKKEMKPSKNSLLRV